MLLPSTSDHLNGDSESERTLLIDQCGGHSTGELRPSDGPLIEERFSQDKRDTTSEEEPTPLSDTMPTASTREFTGLVDITETSKTTEKCALMYMEDLTLKTDTLSGGLATMEPTKDGGLTRRFTR